MGTRWEYVVTGTGMEGTSSSEVRDISGDEITLSGQSACTTQGDDIEYESVSVFDGSETATGLEYEEACVAVPAEMEVGTTWRCQTTATSRSDPGGTSESDIDYTYEVVDQREASVEAGTWDAFEVEHAAFGKPYSYWYAGGVGLVQSYGTELTRYSP